MSKKILIISSIILLIFALALAGYYFLLQSNEKVSTGDNNFGIGDLFPFGSGANQIDNTASSTDFTYSPTDTPIESFEKRLRLISKEPVAGSVFKEANDGLKIRYAEKATGHIYDSETGSNKKIRISNTTIPQIEEVYFAGNGDSFIARYLKNNDLIETFYGNLVGTSTEKIIDGKIFSENLVYVSVSPSQKSIFHIEKKEDSVFGLLQKVPSKDKVGIWSSRFTEFLPEMMSDRNILLTTKFGFSQNGFAYILDTNTSKLKPILQNILGLSTKPDLLEEKILFYTSRDDGSLQLLDLKTSIISEVTPKTFPEKCAFSSSSKNILYCGVSKNTVFNNSLGNWYLGLVSFSDNIWRYDLATGVSEKIIDLKNESGRDIDVIKPKVSKDGLFLIFESKTDGSLWSLNVSL